jgi:hypothetical protein
VLETGAVLGLVVKGGGELGLELFWVISEQYNRGNCDAPLQALVDLFPVCTEA